MLPRLLGSISFRSLIPPWIERSAPWLTIAPSASRPAASSALLAASADASSRAAMRSFRPAWPATSRSRSSPPRAGHREVDRQHGDAGRVEPRSDRGVCRGVVMVLDVKVDLSADRVGGIVDRRLRVAPVVVEHEFDGEEPGSEDEALTDLATDE